MRAPDIGDAPPVNFALYFASHGLRVLPIPGKSKRPTIKDWPNVATTDPDQICRWFEKEPAGNYGILCDDLIGVDVDPRHGGHHWHDDNLPRLPETWQFKTGGGGLHLLYKAPPGVRIGNRANIAQGVDIRGIGANGRSLL